MKNYLTTQTNYSGKPSSHSNNLDFLRLFFAVSVLITHSYALTGLPETDVLSQFSHGQAVLSHTGVQGFLVISGFLITKSLLRSHDLSDYFTKRILRVFPGLVVLVSLTALICAFFSNKSVLAYFDHYSFRDYIVFNAVLKTRCYIDGIFANNPYPNNVNGSLWTIPYEFFFYILLSACFFVREKVTLLRWVFVALFLLTASLFLKSASFLHAHEVPFWSLQGDKLAELAAFFFSGAVWAVFPMPSVDARRKIALGAVLLLLISFYYGGYHYIQFILLPLLVISFGTMNTKTLSWVRKYGDFSFGIYLWGFFIQQALVHLFHLSLLPLMAVSIPLTYLAGAMSWHLVEKRALAYKTKTKLAPLPEPVMVVAAHQPNATPAQYR